MTAAAEAGLPLTAAQLGMWYVQALDPAGPALNTAEYLDIPGPLDPAVFAEALRRVTAEADALRVRLADTPDGPRQIPYDPPQLPLTVLDLRAGPDPEGRAHAWMRGDLAEPFDLAAGPLFAHALLRTADRHWLWYQRIHHAVMDGYGYSLLVRRTAELYTALAAGGQPPPGRFGRLAELVADDAAYRTSPQHAADRDHWSAALAGRPPAPGLAGRTALPSRTLLRRTARLGAEPTARLKELATSLRVTWPEVLIAVQGLYVARATGADEVALGVPMMGRMGSAALRVPGMVMNVAPVLLRPDPAATLAEIVQQAVAGLRRARRHQRYRYEDIRRDLGLLGAGRPLTGPLVNVMPFDYDVSFAGTPARAHNLSAGPVDDLTVNVYDRADGGGLRIDHDANPALYDDAELAAHQERFLELLAAVTAPGADPHVPSAAYGIATAAERALVQGPFNDTARPLPPTTLIGPIEAQANRTPDATALVYDGRSLTYAELNARANRLARHLATLGVRPGTLAAVALPRSAELVVALLAVLKAGGAYLPLDPDYPAERLAYMIEDAAPVCVVSDLPGRVPAADGVPNVVLEGLDLSPYLTVNPPRPLTRNDPAYVIYTSGSTGRPKGVVVPHSAIDNRLRWMQHEYGLTPGDRVLQKTPSGFDVSVWEFFWALREGAAVVMAAPGGHRDPGYLARTIREHAVTTCHFVPSMLQVFLAAPDSAHCTGLRRVFCSGEALPRETAEDFHRVLPGVPLHNLYGPTEAAVDVTHHTCEPGATGPVPIGTPVWNTRLHVLDAALQPCPPGVPGELYLAGAQLAAGYLGRPALTAARFVADPYGPPASRMYRTGDLARWTPRGAVEYLGRTDQQVKLHGQRIEPGEIEAALTALDGVDAACVLVREDRPGDQRLVAYVTGAPADPAVPADPADPADPAVPAALRDRLAAVLPAHMVPGAVVVLDAFPLSPNGKLDRAALPAPAYPPGGGEGRAPDGRTEQVLVELFAEVLDVDRVGVDDVFFDLGGTSLLAVRLVGRIRETLGAEPTIGTVFEAPTPAALAARLERALPADDALGVLLPLRTTGERPPLFVFHPAGGISWCYAGLLSRLGPDQPLYGLQAHGLTGGGGELPATMEEMAADYTARLRAVRPHGPYRLLGWSVGGVVAHTVAVRLRAAGERVDLLALLDAYPSDQWREQAGPTEADALTAVLRMAGFERSAELTRDDVLATLRREGSALAGLTGATLSAVVDIVVNNARLMREHRHGVFDGDALFFTATAPRAEDWLTRDAWQPYVTGGLANHDVDCLHPEMTRPRQLDEIAAVLTARLKEIDA